jgi:hypothetical protein
MYNTAGLALTWLKIQKRVPVKNLPSALSLWKITGHYFVELEILIVHDHHSPGAFRETHSCAHL